MLDAEGHIKIIDFGLAQFIDGPYLGCGGSMNYLSPEAIRKENRNNYTIDYYGIGVILYEMLTGKPPFYNEIISKMNYAILTEQVSFPDFISDNCKDLLLKLLEKNPEDRIGKKSIEEIKNHEWFSGINWDLVKNRKMTPPFLLDIANPCIYKRSDNTEMYNKN